MPKVEITIPEHLEMQIAQMVERGEFVNREEAIEDLLSTGIKATRPADRWTKRTEQQAALASKMTV